MKNVKRLVAACFVAALLIGAFTAAQANASISECPSGWVCLWQNELFTGRMLQFRDSGAWQNLTDYGFNDQTSSIYNHTSRYIQISWDINGGEPRRCFGPQESYGVMPGNWNNNASAVRLLVFGTSC